jgi:hypothetical protein
MKRLTIKPDHILIDRRRLSNILDVRSFRAADADADYYLVVAQVRKRLAVSKQTTHRVHMERFNLKKLRFASTFSPAGLMTIFY